MPAKVAGGTETIEESSHVEFHWRETWCFLERAQVVDI